MSDCPNGATPIRRFVMPRGSSRATRMAMVSAKSMSKRSRGSGRCSTRGCAPPGVSQEKPLLYLGFFEYIHNVRKRGKALLGALIGIPREAAAVPGFLRVHSQRPEAG